VDSQLVIITITNGRDVPQTRSLGFVVSGLVRQGEPSAFNAQKQSDGTCYKL